MAAGKILRRAIVSAVALGAAAGGVYWFGWTMYRGISAPFSTEVQVTNRVGQSITLYTDHTKRTVRIPVGAVAVVPHTAGRVTVTTDSGVIWTYGTVDITDPDNQNEVWRAHLRLTLPLTVERSGALLLASGRRIEPLSKQAEQ